MIPFKEIIPELFEDSELDRVDYYIDKIRSSLNSTNRLYMFYQTIQILTIIVFYLFHFNKLNDISFLGLKLTDKQLIDKWFLIIPSTFFLLSAYTGYLRVYQREGIEWLLARHRNKEYESKIFKLTYPANHILGMELLNKQKSKAIKIITYLPTLIIAFVSVAGPIVLVFIGYGMLKSKYLLDIQLSISFAISFFMFSVGILVIKLSQRI